MSTPNYHLDIEERFKQLDTRVQVVEVALFGKKPTGDVEGDTPGMYVTLKTLADLVNNMGEQFRRFADKMGSEMRDMQDWRLKREAQVAGAVWASRFIWFLCGVLVSCAIGLGFKEFIINSIVNGKPHP